MTATDLSLSDLEQLVYLLTAAGVPATLEPEDVSLPGAWVTLESFETRTLKGTPRITAAVYLIAENKDHRRALEALRDLYNSTRTVLRPDGPVVSQGVILPGAPTEAMPALRVPVYLSGNPSDNLPLGDYVLETT
jgi:hypothetical protein